MIPYIKGIVAKQAHVDIPEGTYEEEYGRNGFFGKYAHLYRSGPPVGWSRIEGPLKPRAFNLNQTLSTDQMRVPILFNQDVSISISIIEKDPSYYFRNADGDEVQFVHAGSGTLETDFGILNYTEGDYLIIPRGTMYQFRPNRFTKLLTIESFSEVNFPEKGLLGQHALFDPAVINVPTPLPLQKSMNHEYELRIKHRGEITRVFYPNNPNNTVGWKGTLCVQQLNVRDIRPIVSDRYHLPPSAHSTFVGHNFVICTFLPRPLENGDPKAMKVPFYHSNIDFDEVIFYHSGNFFSRDNIQSGMMTFHPQGIQHGPHRNAISRSSHAQRTDEVAIMIDTRRPLELSKLSKPFEIENYWRSWQ